MQKDHCLLTVFLMPSTHVDNITVKSIENNKLRKTGVSYVSFSWFLLDILQAQWNASLPWLPLPGLIRWSSSMFAQHHHHSCHSQVSVCLSLDFELLTERMRSIYSKDPNAKSNMHLNHQAITKNQGNERNGERQAE